LDTDSVASSVTCVAGSISVLASPSPTAADFHTPLQTPSALTSFLHPEPTKKPKKKKNKKKPGTASAVPGQKAPDIDEAFREQLAQLDSHKSSSSYYSNRSQQPDRKTEEEVIEEEEKV
jgi:hypothetical protein